MKSIALLSFVFSVTALAQDMSAADNKCRVEAKEIALKSYQSCVTTARTARLEQIRKEYQEKLSELKKQYESQLTELKNQNKVSANQKKEEASSANEPTVTLKKAKSAKNGKNQKVASKTKPSNAPAIITEAELEKSAPAQVDTASETAANSSTTNEVNEAAAAAATESETLQVIDPTLPPATQVSPSAQ